MAGHPAPRILQRTSESFAAALSPTKLREETETDLDILLQRYAEPIARMQRHEALKPLLDPSEHDEVFLLRHLLSAKGQVEKATQSAEQCVRWRREHANLLSRVDELHRTVKKILPVGMLPHTTSHGQPVQVVMPFQVNLERFAKASLDWHFESGIANREVAFRLCDRSTRQRRRLIKVVLLQDLSGLTFSFAYSQYRLGSVQGKLSKISSFVYPQVRRGPTPKPRARPGAHCPARRALTRSALGAAPAARAQMLATVVIVHAPSFINALFRMASNFLAQKVLDKMKVCSKVEEVRARRTAAEPSAARSRAAACCCGRIAAASVRRSSGLPAIGSAAALGPRALAAHRLAPIVWTRLTAPARAARNCCALRSASPQTCRTTACRPSSAAASTGRPSGSQSTCGRRGARAPARAPRAGASTRSPPRPSRRRRAPQRPSSSSGAPSVLRRQALARRRPAQRAQRPRRRSPRRRRRRRRQSARRSCENGRGRAWWSLCWCATLPAARHAGRAPGDRPTRPARRQLFSRA